MQRPSYHPVDRDQLLRAGTLVGGGSICDTYRTSWAGRTVFAKTLDAPPPGFFAAEERGLRWLAEAGMPVPAVLYQTDDLLVLEWVDEGRPSREAAEQLGRDLAELHSHEAQYFGGDGSGPIDPGYIGSLPLDNTQRESWPAFYAEQRVLPYLRSAVDRGAIDDGGRRTIERLCDQLAELAGPDERPSRIHGDLWSGNVLWAAPDASGVARARLIDPAAHGGHRETDLAMLDLFGLPQLTAVLAAYETAFPLADGWRERTELHQLHPLLVHAALFGGGYGHRAVAAAQKYVGRLA